MEKWNVLQSCSIFRHDKSESLHSVTIISKLLNAGTLLSCNWIVSSFSISFWVGRKVIQTIHDLIGFTKIEWRMSTVSSPSIDNQAMTDRLKFRLAVGISTRIYFSFYLNKFECKANISRSIVWGNKLNTQKILHLYLCLSVGGMKQEMLA